MIKAYPMSFLMLITLHRPTSVRSTAHRPTSVRYITPPHLCSFDCRTSTPLVASEDVVALLCGSSTSASASASSSSLQSAYAGVSVLELGAGCGPIGSAMAALGAHVVVRL